MMRWTFSNAGVGGVRNLATKGWNVMGYVYRKVGSGGFWGGSGSWEVGFYDPDGD